MTSPTANESKTSPKGKSRRLLQQPNLVQLGYLCRRVMAASLVDLQATLPELDVTSGQMGTLVLIACNPGITPTEICRAQGREKATITASLEKLSKKKLIRRRTPASDRRSYEIFLTKKGKALYDRVNPLAHESDLRLTKSLTAEERTVMMRLMLRIYFAECCTEEEAELADGAAIELTLKADQPNSTKRGSIRTRFPESGRDLSRKGRAEISKRLRELELSSAKLRKAMHEFLAK
jgi:DNA-binding MarR family transcriptional regulator